MSFSITSKNKSKRAVTGYVAGCTEAVLKGEYCKHKAVPVSPKPRTLVIRPSEAITVPPGTPGAPIANIPRRTQNKTIVPTVGTEP